MYKPMSVKTISTTALITLSLLLGGLAASPAPVVFAKVMPHSIPPETGFNAPMGTIDDYNDQQNQIAGMPYLIISQQNNSDSRISRLLR